MLATYPAKPITLDETKLRQAIYDSAATFLGLKELTDHNDAEWISKINLSNGLPERSLYCASGFYFAHRINGVKLPIKAVGMVASYFADPKKIIYRRNQRGNQRKGIKPRRMDAVSLYFSHIEGLAVEEWDMEDEEVYLIGFNTTGGRGTTGGCYRNRRKKSEIKLIANWITPYLLSLKQ